MAFDQKTYKPYLINSIMKTLSDKIVDACSIDSFTVIEAEDVKDFIKNILEEIESIYDRVIAISLSENIKTMAGDKLI